MVNHYLPSSLDEALTLLHEQDLEIIAGGTDLMVQRRTWANTPPQFDHTMNIMHLKELKDIQVEGDEMHIGATVNLTDVYHHPQTPEVLKKAIYDIASPALRNVATIAGNIGNASPAGDTLPILYALHARVVLQSLHNTRIVPVEEVITGPRTTTIQPNELITKIILPLQPFTVHHFVKVGGRKADAISKVSFTGVASIEDNVIKDLRICFGAVAPVMVKSRTLEQSLIGRTTQDLQNQLPSIIESYDALIRPIDDQRSNKTYRKVVARNLLKDFLQSL